MPKLITAYWRDIPALVIAQRGRSKFKQQLAPRFARAIVRAATRAGRGSSKAYLSDWRRESAPCNGNLKRAVLEQIVRLEAAFPDEVLEGITKRGGKRETHAAGFDRPSSSSACESTRRIERLRQGR